MLLQGERGQEGVEQQQLVAQLTIEREHLIEISVADVSFSGLLQLKSRYPQRRGLGSAQGRQHEPMKIWDERIVNRHLN